MFAPLIARRAGSEREKGFRPRGFSVPFRFRVVRLSFVVGIAPFALVDFVC